MAPIDYIALLQQEFTEYSNKLRQRQEIDLDLAQREQFIRATVNMLPDDQKSPWESLLDAISAGDVGLSESIRNVLKHAPRKFYTATETKQMLAKSGFDFSKYTANPLSSVHAALKRLKAEEAEMSQIDGVMAWRWIKTQPVQNSLLRRYLDSVRLNPVKESAIKEAVTGLITLGDEKKAAGATQETPYDEMRRQIRKAGRRLQEQRAAILEGKNNPKE